MLCYAQMISKIKEKYFLYLHLQYSKTSVNTGNNSERKYCASCLLSHCHSMQLKGESFYHLQIANGERDNTNG